jgi:hypothetical protein
MVSAVGVVSGRFSNIPDLSRLRVIALGLSSMDANSSTDNAVVAPLHRRNRSRVINGNRTVPLSDGRGLWARLMRDTFRNLEVHVGGEFTETQRLMARRISTLEAELCFYEDQFAQARIEGREPDPNKVELYGRLAERQRRLAEAALGWLRSARDMTPSWSEIAAEVKAEKREHEDVT